MNITSFSKKLPAFLLGLGVGYFIGMTVTGYSMVTKPSNWEQAKKFYENKQCAKQACDMPEPGCYEYCYEKEKK